MGHFSLQKITTMAKQLIIFLVILYICSSMLLFLLQRKILYFPQPASQISATTQLQPVSYESGQLTLTGWVLNPGKTKGLLYYGGNAEQIEQNIPFFKALDLPYSVYLIPYRGYGRNSGEPSEQALYNDALAIYDQIRLDHSELALMGRSLGSGIATHVAAKRDISTLVLVTPYDSIQNVAQQAYKLFPINLLIKDRFRSWANVQNIQADTLIVAAEHDRIIRPERTQALATYFDSSKLNTVTVRGADHNNIALYPAYSEAIKDHLK